MFLLFNIFMACDDSMDEPLSCTAEYVYSSTIELTDQSGQPVEDALITYTVDGEDGEMVEEMFVGNYAVGGEESGAFIVDIYIEIEDPDDSCCLDLGTATLEFVVESDECHVITQRFSPELNWDRVCLDAEDCG